MDTYESWDIPGQSVVSTLDAILYIDPSNRGGGNFLPAPMVTYMYSPITHVLYRAHPVSYRYGV